MSDEITGKRIAFLAADGVERVELVQPWDAVEKAGGRPSLISLEKGSIRSFDHLDPSEEFAVDATAADADASRFDGLVLPGGVATNFQKSAIGGTPGGGPVGVAPPQGATEVAAVIADVIDTPRPEVYTSDVLDKLAQRYFANVEEFERTR